VGDNFDNTLAMHWDGASWSDVPTPIIESVTITLFGVEAIEANDVWAVGYYDPELFGERTLILHWNGTAWSQVLSPNVGSGKNILRGVSAVSAGDVWAVGFYENSSQLERTLILHWNGSGWTTVQSPNGGTNFPNALFGVAAIAANDV
jgi:hypothetical protein